MIKNRQKKPKKCCDPGIFSDRSGNSLPPIFGDQQCTAWVANATVRGQMDFMNFPPPDFFFDFYFFGKIGYENVQFRGRTLFFMPLWLVR